MEGDANEVYTLFKQLIEERARLERSQGANL